MKLINSSVSIINQEPGIKGLYKNIERASRTCYKSESMITKTSAEEFVERMVQSGHHAMLEHGTVYLRFCTVSTLDNPLNKYYHNKYSRVHTERLENKVIMFVTTNYRELVKNGWLEDLKYICPPTEHHDMRIMARFIIDKGISHEFVRHRVFSFAQESTRFCNYSKDKFDNQLTFIIPSHFKTVKWSSDEELLKVYPKEKLDRFNHYYAEDSLENDWIISMLTLEIMYLDYIAAGMKPQQARSVLPHAIKTELVMTGFIEDWEHFFDLRMSSKAHPDACKVATELCKEFREKHLL